MSDYRNHQVYTIIMTSSTQFILLNSDITSEKEICSHNAKIEDNMNRERLNNNIRTTMDKTSLTVLHVYKISSYLDVNVTLLLFTVGIAREYPRTNVPLFTLPEVDTSDSAEEDEIITTLNTIHNIITIIKPLYKVYYKN